MVEYHILLQTWKMLLSDSSFTSAQRCANSAVYIHTSKQRGILVFAGYDGSYFLDNVLFFNLQSNEWESFSTSGKAPAVSSFCYALWRKRYMLAFGGVGRKHSNMYQLDLFTREWSVLYMGPECDVQEAAHCLVGDNWYLANGNELKCFHLVTKQWSTVGMLPGYLGSNAAMTYDHVNSNLYLSGGSSGALDDSLWCVPVPRVIVIPLLYSTLQQHCKFTDLTVQCQQ